MDNVTPITGHAVPAQNTQNPAREELPIVHLTPTVYTQYVKTAIDRAAALCGLIIMAIPMLLIGVLAAIVHLLVILSYTWSQASHVVPLVYLQIVGGLVLGYFMFGDTPDWITLAGIVVIVSAGAFIALRESGR